MDEERQRFEQWYATHALNHERDPIGSRDCGLQWAAWQAGSESHRAELAEWKATTPAPKPDCRTCAHVYTDMKSYGCKRSTTIIVCIKGDGYVPSLPVRLYETGGE